MPAPAALELTNVTKTYPGRQAVHALRDVSLRARRGELVAVMSIPPVALYSAVASALTVGVLAGLYPALRATRLAPAEVLRSA